MTVNDLKTYGADTEEGLRRCMNNESFYLRLVNMALDDAGFGKLSDAVGNDDRKAAFEAAHALKGSAGNLSLTPIFAPISEITELLRARTQTDYSALINQIREARDELAHICEE